MRIKQILNIIEIIYTVLVLLVVGLYVLWLEMEASLGTPPSWLYTAVWVSLIPAVILMIKEGIDFLVHLLNAGDSDA